MPVFNLELKFDDKGALEAVNQIDRVTDATNGATNATDELGKKGTKNLDELADSASNAARSIDKFKRETEQASRNVGEISVSAANTSKVVDQLGKSVQEAIDKLSGISPVTDKATDSTEELGDKARESSRGLSDMGDSGTAVADAIASKMKKAASEVLGLVGAFKAIQGAMGFLSRGLEFNASLEQSRIGIASLITSMVKLQDEQGKLLEGQEKYNAAQGIAADLMKEIQRLGLETTATSESLVEGVQSIMGPALQAGMALKDIPKFAVAGAQAMQTLGVPLNQMRTELDALLTGNVNKTQDILAPKLFADIKGDLGEYIRGLKQSGKLIDEIFKRLQPFVLAGQDVSQTWGALTSNLSEALNKLAGDTSLNYTKAMKQSVNELQNLLLDTNTGTISKDFEHIAKLVAEIQDWIGNKIVASTETLVSLAKDLNNFLGSSFGTGVIETFIGSIKLAAGALAGFATARALAFGKDVATDKITAATQAIERYRNKIVETANSQLEAAIAERNRQQAFMATARAQEAAANSEKIREAQLARQDVLINRVAIAERNLAQATSMSVGQLSKLAGSGLLKLVNLVGGPFNAALMGIGTATAYLATKQTEAEKAADLHSSALQKLNEIQKAAAESSKTLADNLGEVAEARRLMAIDEATEAVQRFANQILQLDFSAATGFLPDFREEAESLDEMIFQLANGKGSFEDFTKSLASFYNKLNEAGEASSRLGNRVKEALDLAAKGVDAETVLKKLRGEIDAVTETAQKNVSVIQDLNNANADLQKGIEYLNKAENDNVNTLEGALKWLEKRNSETEEGKKKQEEMAKATDENALATLRLAVAQAQAEAAMGIFTLASGNATEQQVAEANAKIEAFNKLQGKLNEFASNAPKFGVSGSSKKGKSGGSSGSGMSAENAAEKWKDLSDQLAQLEGKATSSAASLDKTLKSIEDTGKAAKKSAKEIEDMKQAFIAATDKKSLQDLNKELLQLEGNTKALQNIERQEKTDQLRAKINDIRSLSEDEKNILLNRVDTAVQNEFRVKDMQTAVDFMKDLESLGGSYGESIAMQNQLIEYQASLYRDNLGPEFDGYVAQWERLKILGNDKSFMAGLERGVRKFGADYGDVANQVEQFTTQMGSTISNTLADAFMKGKFSAQDFFSSLISMAAQAASNAFIGQIFSGLGNAFGGLFSSGNYNGLNASAAQGAANTSGYAGMGMRWSGGSAHGNVFSGGNLSDFSNSIVSRPTFFGFSTHFSKYARGAGLMGEAGPEAIMPLSRTKSGDLGVQMVGGWNTTPIVNVKVVNESGNPVDAQSQATPNGMGGFDLEIIISQVEQGIVSRAKQGKSQLMQYQQAAYGIDRAPVIARGRGRS